METAEKMSYLPLSVVVREDSDTTKVRVVFDASCRDKLTKRPLDYSLHVGPSLTPLLFDILLRFRNETVAIVGDIAKAFLNIEVDPKDWDCLRFLWLSDISKADSDIITVRFNHVVLGVNCSPFLFNAVLRYHFLKFEDLYKEFFFPP